MLFQLLLKVSTHSTTTKNPDDDYRLALSRKLLTVYTTGNYHYDLCLLYK